MDAKTFKTFRISNSCDSESEDGVSLVVKYNLSGQPREGLPCNMLHSAGNWAARCRLCPGPPWKEKSPAVTSLGESSVPCVDSIGFFHLVP